MKDLGPSLVARAQGATARGRSISCRPWTTVQESGQMGSAAPAVVNLSGAPWVEGLRAWANLQPDRFGRGCDRVNMLHRRGLMFVCCHRGVGPHTDSFVSTWSWLLLVRADQPARVWSEEGWCFNPEPGDLFEMNLTVTHGLRQRRRGLWIAATLDSAVRVPMVEAIARLRSGAEDDSEGRGWP